MDKVDRMSSPNGGCGYEAVDEDPVVWNAGWWGQLGEFETAMCSGGECGFALDGAEVLCRPGAGRIDRGPEFDVQSVVGDFFPGNDVWVFLYFVCNRMRIIDALKYDMFSEKITDRYRLSSKIFFPPYVKQKQNFQCM